jgi:prepilin peptidase CpaA
MDQLASLPLATLPAIVSFAVVHDSLSRRIPNGLVLTGMALGLFFQTFAPDGKGLFSGGHGLGLEGALLGALTAFAMFFPLYLLRIMGAGDVKLLAMIGVWMGPAGAAWTTLWTMLAGGALSIAAALWSGALRQVVVNLHIMAATRSLLPVQAARDPHGDAAPTATGRLPYALAIAAGMTTELLRMQWA